MANYSTKIYSCMNSTKFLKDEINNFLRSLKDLNKLTVPSDSTTQRLLNIIKTENFDKHSNKEIEFFRKKFEVSNKLLEHYKKSGFKSSEEILSQEGLQIFACSLYLYILMIIDQKNTEIKSAQYINTCLKAFDQIKLPDFLNSERNKLKHFQYDLLKKLPVSSLNSKTLICKKISEITKINHQNFKTIPVDVLFYEGPIARAYLEMLYSLRCKPRRIINLVAKRDLVTKKSIGMFLPSFLRYKYAAKVQSQKIHYWPQYLFRNQKKICFEIFEQLRESFGINESVLMGILKLKPLENYSDTILSLPIDTLKDQNLFSYINQQNASIYLFTGGGIMPKSFFSIKNTRYIHIHPGYLPDIRGADCLLWSVLLAGYPSATSFFMDSTIDTGDIIKATFLPKIFLPAKVASLDKKMIYRLLYSFIDPWIRSVVLRDTLISTNYLQNINVSSQKKEEGTTFNFMHEKMISEVIKLLSK